MAGFRLATIEQRGQERSALVVDERLFPLADLAPERPELQGGLFALLGQWDEVWPTLQWLAERADPRRGGSGPDARSVRLLTPIRYPRAVYTTVFNYYDFAADVGGPSPDKSQLRPYICTKLPNCVIGPDEAIVLPHHTQRVDWGVELGVVIGRRCYGAFARDALDYVAGYTIVNNLSARDGSRQDWPRLGYDWLLSQGFDTSAPIGPYLLPKAFVSDPHRLRLRLSRNGELIQDGSTATMVFSIAEQIEFLSSFVTLQPGDVVATGTPAGVGWQRGVFLRPGDELVCEIEGIGTLRNPVVGPLMLAPPYGGSAYA